MANIFYQALRKLKPFEEKKDGLSNWIPVDKVKKNSL
jgi:hypothetical protein